MYFRYPIRTHPPLEVEATTEAEEITKSSVTCIPHSAFKELELRTVCISTSSFILLILVQLTAEPHNNFQTSFVFVTYHPTTIYSPIKLLQNLFGMSGLDSWEDDESVRDEGLSRQTQQSLNLNGQNGQAQSFTPNANTFQPGAQSFQPGQPFQPTQQYQQYGGYNQPQHNQYYNHQQQQQQYAGGYSQYGQQNYNQYNQGYGSQQDHNYNQMYNAQYGNYEQPQSYSQTPQPRQTPIIAKRPAVKDAPPSGTSAPAPPPAEVPSSVAPTKAKVLSITGDVPAPKAKVLSIGATTPVKKEAPPVEDGTKATALKAIEKTEKSSGASTNKSTSAPNSGKSSPTPGEAKAAVREAEAVAKEQAADVDEEILEEVYGKEHVNIVISLSLC